MRSQPILLVGCGKMGGALLDGWLSKGMAENDLVVIEPHRFNRTSIRSGITVLEDLKDLKTDFSPEVILFAVKPQVLDTVVPLYKNFKAEGLIYISIAAGRTLASYESLLGSDAGIIRVMPNTPASIGQGISVACGNRNVTDAQKENCLELFKAVGVTAWIDEEGLMDPVTAVSGSGPAYVFLLIEALTEAGLRAGLEREFAEKLAKVTVAGSGALALEARGSPANLREAVTSPGGTTSAALDVLMGESGMKKLMEQAVQAATLRSRILAK